MSNKVPNGNHQLTEEDKLQILNFCDAMYSNPTGSEVFWQSFGHIYEEVVLKFTPLNCQRSLSNAILELVKSYLGETGPATVKMLDVGAGTGLFGKHLHDRGFNNIEALDISPAMLALARKKEGVYTKYHNVGITTSPTPGIESRTYNLVVSCGGFSYGSIAMECIFELARMVKRQSRITCIQLLIYLFVPTLLPSKIASFIFNPL